MQTPTLFAALALAALATTAQLAAAHGYLSSPPPRGIEKAAYNIDSLKSPNRNGLCRGEKPGKVTPVQAGQTLRLGLTITAPHVGPCRLTMLDVNLKNEVPVAEKMDCAAPGNPGFWNVKLPAGVSGRKVLRWYWEGRHVSPSEPYEQCIDVVFGGGNGQGSGGDDAEADNGDEADNDQDRPVRSQGSASKAPKSSAPRYDDNDAENEQPQGEPRQAPRPASRPSPSDTRGNSGRRCTDGAMRCQAASGRSAGFLQCANGQWVKKACSSTLVCKDANSSITCDWP